MRDVKNHAGASPRARPKDCISVKLNLFQLDE